MPFKGSLVRVKQGQFQETFTAEFLWSPMEREVRRRSLSQSARHKLRL